MTRLSAIEVALALVTAILNFGSRLLDWARDRRKAQLEKRGR